MMHLFYIHSFITFLVAKSIVKVKQLEPLNCVFLYGRGFRPVEISAGIREIEMPYTHHPVKSFSIKRKFWISWKELGEFDRFVDNLTAGKEFELYTNQTGIDFIRLFVTHKKCNSFSFLEEGIASYHSLQTINTLLCPAGKSTLVYKVLVILNYKGRLTLQKWFYDPAYTFAFGVTPESFPGFGRKVLLPSPFINNDSVPALHHILVLDATAEYSLVKNESIIAALAIGLKAVAKNNVTKLWVKYHPDQLLNPQTMMEYKKFFNSLSNQIQVEELPQEICLERIAGNKSLENVNFYVFLSSVGLYAGLLGRKVFSFAKLVGQFEPQYRNHIDSLPTVYKSRITFISE